MKKIILTVSIITVLLLIIGCMSMLLFLSSNTLNDEGKSDFYWIEEESYFVDYVIENNKIVFSYSINFVNNSDSDVSVSVSTKFRKSEICKWIKYQDYFIGYDEYGNMKYETIKAGEQKNIIFYFEGDFISDNINTKLSFPNELIITTK